MSAREKLFAGGGRFGRDFTNPLARFTPEPFTPGIITREQLVRNVAQLGANLTSRINAFQERTKEIKVRNAPVLNALPRMGIVETARQKFLGHQRELPHILKHLPDIRKQLGSVRTNELVNSLIGADMLSGNRDWLGQLTLRLNQGATISTAPLFFPVLGSRPDQSPLRRRKGALQPKTVSREKQKDNTTLYIISGAVIGGGILIGAISAFASVPDDGGDGPIIHPTRTPTPTDTGHHDQLKATAQTTPTAVAIAIETTVAYANKPMVILCPPEDGKSPVIVPDNLKEKINPDGIQIKAVPAEQQDHLAKLYAAIDAKNFGPDAVVMCTPNNSIGEAGVSYVVQVFSFNELSTGQVTHSEHLFVHFGDNRGLVGVTENRLLTPGGNTWLPEQGYETNHFVIGKQGDANYFDGVLYYKLDVTNGNEYVAGVLTKDGLVTGKTMIEKFGQVFAKTPFAVATRASDINNGHQVAYFGYSEAQFEGQTVLQLTAYDSDNQVIWPAILDQGGEANQATVTNEKVFDLLKAKGAGELTFDGIKWHTTIDGKEVIFTGASIEDPTFAYLYAADGSRIWAVNEQGTDYKEIVLTRIGRYMSGGQIKETDMKSPVTFTSITRSESGRFTDGVFFYYPEADEWYSVDNLTLPSSQEWKQTRTKRFNEWVESVKITREPGRTTEFTAEQIRDYLRKYGKYIDADDSILTQIDTKEGRKTLLVDKKLGLIPIESGSYRDPLWYMVNFVKEIRLDSRQPSASVNYGEAKIGMMRLNPTGNLAGWDIKLLGVSTLEAIAKEASGIEWSLKRASDVCALGGKFVQLAEANTNIAGIKVWQALLRHLSDNDPAENAFEYNIPFHLLNRAKDYENPALWPACF